MQALPQWRNNVCRCVYMCAPAHVCCTKIKQTSAAFVLVSVPLSIGQEVAAKELFIIARTRVTWAIATEIRFAKIIMVVKRRINIVFVCDTFW